MREREGLIVRIRQIRRLAAAAEKPSAVTTGPDPDAIHLLEARIAHLEQLVEGLQDSVHRESARQAKLIAELEARIQPSAMGAAQQRRTRARALGGHMLDPGSRRRGLLKQSYAEIPR